MWWKASKARTAWTLRSRIGRCSASPTTRCGRLLPARAIAISRYLPADVDADRLVPAAEEPFGRPAVPGARIEDHAIAPELEERLGHGEVPNQVPGVLGRPEVERRHVSRPPELLVGDLRRQRDFGELVVGAGVGGRRRRERPERLGQRSRERPGPSVEPQAIAVPVAEVIGQQLRDAPRDRKPRAAGGADEETVLEDDLQPAGRRRGWRRHRAQDVADRATCRRRADRSDERAGLRHAAALRLTGVGSRERGLAQRDRGEVEMAAGTDDELEQRVPHAETL
jgi:hypothetical protein